MLKRLAILLLVLAVLVTLGLPGLMGLAIEHGHPIAVAGVDERLEHARLRPLPFDRGWFASGGQIDIVSDGGATLRWQARIEQGLRPTRGSWMLATGTLHHPEHGVLGNLTLELGLTGSVFGQIIVTTPQLSAEASYRIEPGYDRLAVVVKTVDLDSPAASVAAMTGELNVVGLNQRPLSIALQLAAASAHMEQRQLARPRLDWSVNADGGAIESRLQLAADHVQSAAGLWQAPRLDFQLDSLHESTTLGMLERIGAAPEHARSELLWAIPLWLNHQPRIELREFAWIMDGIPGLARFSAALTEPPPAGFMADPSVLIPVLSLSAEASAPRRLVRSWVEQMASDQLGVAGNPETIAVVADDQLARMRANRILIESGESFRFEMTLNEELLTLNGQPMMLPAF